MKKFLLVFVSIVLCLSFCACGTANETRTTPVTETASATPTETQAMTETPGVSPSPAPVKEKPKVNAAFLSGSTGLGASKLIADAKTGSTFVDYQTLDIIADPTAVIAGLKTGKYDVAALPVNVAAKLYNMPDVDVEVVALNTLGVLYVLENETETVKTVADLKGKTVYTTGEGATPQYILEYVLKKNGLEVGKDVTVVYRATADEVPTDAMASGAVVMLPEPKATVTTKQITTLRYALDMTVEWEKVCDSKLTQGCVVALKSFVANGKASLDAFLAEYQTSVAFVNKADDAAAQAVVDAGIIGKAPIAKAAIPRSNLVCLTGAEMKIALSGTLKALFELDPKSVGGKLPGDEFYYGT